MTMAVNSLKHLVYTCICLQSFEFIMLMPEKNWIRAARLLHGVFDIGMEIKYVCEVTIRTFYFYRSRGRSLVFYKTIHLKGVLLNTFRDRSIPSRRPQTFANNVNLYFWFGGNKDCAVDKRKINKVDGRLQSQCSQKQITFRN